MCDIANPTPDSGTRRPTRHLRSSISHITKMLGSKLRTRGATLVAALMLLGIVAGERTAFAQVTSFTTTFGAASIPLKGLANPGVPGRPTIRLATAPVRDRPISVISGP